MSSRLDVTLVHPRMGGRGDVRSLRTWEMQPLWAAMLKAHTPDWASVRLVDDRLESIDFHRPTDLVGINVETFTALRAYQIADEYRRRGVPVVLGGFHPTLVPEEAMTFADAIVVGEGEPVWPQVLADTAAGRLQRCYEAEAPMDLSGMSADRTVFEGKRYLPLQLVETGRGCPFACEFCAVTRFYGGRYRRRPTDQVIAEVASLPSKRVFFVDDNVVGDGHDHARELFAGLVPLGIQWLSQASIDSSGDEEVLALMARSGCRCLLVGMETLDPDNLALMGKRVNADRPDYDAAIAAFKRHGIPLYVTMMLGYDHDDARTPDRLLAFASRHRLFMAAFNHVTPFPGTPLYERLESESRLRFERWWLDPEYEYGMLPHEPGLIPAGRLETECQRLRRTFYGASSIARRALDPVNTGSPSRAATYFFVQTSLMRDVRRRAGLYLGDPDGRRDLGQDLRGAHPTGRAHVETGVAVHRAGVEA